MPIPLLKAEVPVKTDASSSYDVDCRAKQHISIVLPSDHLRALHDAGPEVPRRNAFLPYVT